MKIILASDSPRRKKLLEATGLRFSVVSCPTREKISLRRPAETVRLNAREKALRAGRLHPGTIIISADTVVYLGQILGKPGNRARAKKMLQLLRGRTHRVYTAVALFDSSRGRMIEKVAVTRVKMKKFGDRTIEKYFSRVNPLDKAGAYAIQERGEMLIEKISGSLSNVIGLPLETLAEALEEIPETAGAASGVKKAVKKLENGY